MLLASLNLSTSDRRSSRLTPSYLLKILKNAEWKVAKLTFFNLSSCPISRVLDFISRDDALVNDIARILVGGIEWFFTMLIILWAMTLVLPDPGPAITIQGPSIWPTANFCSLFSSAISNLLICD